MKEIIEGWEKHNQILKDLGLPGQMTKEEYLAELLRTPLEEHEDAIHASLRNRPKSNNAETK